MADLRTLLAAVLGIGIGLLCIVYPDAIVRVQVVGRLPHDRSGDYGAESSVSTRWRRTVQLLGAGVLVAGVYFGVVALRGVW